MNLRAGLGSMATQMFLLLTVGIAVAAVAAFSLSDMQRRQGERHAQEQRIVDRAADFAGLLERAPPELWPELAEPGPEAPRLIDAAPASDIDQVLSERLAARLGGAAQATISTPQPGRCGPSPPPPAPPPPSADPAPTVDGPARLRPAPHPACRVVALTRAGGRRVAFLLPGPPKPPRKPDPASWAASPVFAAVVALAAALLAFGLSQAATAPLRRLARAATALGRDIDGPPLPLEGSTEVREAARAFNGMQRDLQARIAEQAYMLAAITHDLRTPLTRHRLRLEGVPDPELRARLIDDNTAMQTLIRDGLDLARDIHGEEPMEPLDLDSLLDSLADDAAAAGGNVTVAGDRGVTLRTHPSALRRCLANLVENAVKYAPTAELRVERRGEAVAIHVLDDGPGIPPALLEQAVKPFFRLEASRSRDTGGVGLGLTIAQRLAAKAGGVLTLANRDPSGLDASLLFAAPSSGEGARKPSR